jgi:hypothetical protein
MRRRKMLELITAAVFLVAAVAIFYGIWLRISNPSWTQKYWLLFLVGCVGLGAVAVRWLRFPTRRF